ncbi:MAG: hypothetical protein Q7S90_07810 [Rubrivivax sp.]|nr:hypothetical protein [Rubrivivax sp.]
MPVTTPPPPRVAVERAPRKAATTDPVATAEPALAPRVQPPTTVLPASGEPATKPAVAEATPRPHPAAEVGPAATGPEAKCGGRNPIFYFACMERECWRSEFTKHPDCLAWRKEARRRE